MSSFMSSSSRSSSGVCMRSEILSDFSQKLNIPVNVQGAAARALSVMEKVLERKGLVPLTGALEGRVAVLKEMMTKPTFSEATLRDEMIGLVEKKIMELKPLVAKEKQLELCQKGLTEIPACRISSFIVTVEGFYCKALSEGLRHEEALSFALGKGMARAVINLPSNEDIESDEELQAKINADESFRPYIDPVSLELIRSDPVYLRAKKGVPFERYDQKTVSELLNTTLVGKIYYKKDPITRALVAPGDIKVDYKGLEFVENKLFALIYPELTPELKTESAMPVELEALCSKSFLLALGAAYPLIKKEYEGFSSEPYDPHFLVERVEVFARRTVDRFAFLVDGVSFEGKEGVPAYFPCVKEILRQVESKLIDKNLEVIKAEFAKKIATFNTSLQEIDPAKMLSSSEKEMFEMIEEVSLSRQEGEIREIRKSFPGCLFGVEEWTQHLGVVAKISLPEGMLAILNQPCPITPGKKVGETHMLTLIPDSVNNKPLTLNSLGRLLKEKRASQGKVTGYYQINTAISAGQGDKIAGPSHYVLMTKGVLPGSRGKRYALNQAMGKSYAENQAMVKAIPGTSGAYEVPSALSAATCIFMNYLASSGTRLFSDDPWTFTRCQEQVQNDSIVVGGFIQFGLTISYSSVYDCGYGNYCGVAALRKF